MGSLSQLLYRIGPANFLLFSANMNSGYRGSHWIFFTAMAAIIMAAMIEDCSGKKYISDAEMLKRFKTMFDFIDTDHNDILSKDELRKTKGFDEEEIENLDFYRDGTIDWDDFSSWA